MVVFNDDGTMMITTSTDVFLALEKLIGNNDQVLSGMTNYLTRIELAVESIKDYLRLVDKYEIAAQFIDKSGTSAYKCPELESDLNKALANFWMLGDGVKDAIEEIEFDLKMLIRKPTDMSSGRHSADLVMVETLARPFRRAGNLLDTLDAMMQLRDVIAKEHASVMNRISALVNPVLNGPNEGNEQPEQLMQVYFNLRSINATTIGKLNGSLGTVRDTVREVMFCWTVGDNVLRFVIDTFGSSKCKYLSDKDAPWPECRPIEQAKYQEDVEGESSGPDDE